MDNHGVERIRARAHAIWEEEGRPKGRDVEHWQRAVSEIEAEDPTGAKPAKPGRRSGVKTASAGRNAPVGAREGGVEPVPRRAGKASSSLAVGAKGPASRTAPTAAREGGVEPVPRGGGARKAAAGETSAVASLPDKKAMRAAGTARRIIDTLKPPTSRGRSKKPS